MIVVSSTEKGRLTPWGEEQVKIRSPTSCAMFHVYPKKKIKEIIIRKIGKLIVC